MFQRAGIRTEQQVLILQSQTLLALTAMIDKENFKGNARYVMLLEFHLGILYHSVKVTLQLFHFKVVALAYVDEKLRHQFHYFLIFIACLS